MTKTETALVGASLAIGAIVSAPAGALALLSVGVWTLWKKARKR
jgi:hypothetical protein